MILEQEEALSPTDYSASGTTLILNRSHTLCLSVLTAFQTNDLNFSAI